MLLGRRIPKPGFATWISPATLTLVEKRKAEKQCGQACGAEVARWTGNPNVAGSVPTSVTYIVLVYLYICHIVMYVFSGTNKNLPFIIFYIVK